MLDVSTETEAGAAASTFEAAFAAGFGFGAAGWAAGAAAGVAPPDRAAARISDTLIAPGFFAAPAGAALAAGFAAAGFSAAGVAVAPRAAARISATLIDPGAFADPAEAGVAGLGAFGAGVSPADAAGGPADADSSDGAAAPPRQAARMSSTDIFFLSAIPTPVIEAGIEIVVG